MTKSFTDKKGRFRHFKLSGIAGVQADTIDEQLLSSLIFVGLHPEHGKVVKASKGTTAALFELKSGEKVFVKRYNAYNFKRRFKQYFGTPRPLTTLRATMFLEDFNVLVPKLLIAAPVGHSWRRVTHFVINEAWEGEMTVDDQAQFIFDKEIFPLFCEKLIKLVEFIHEKGMLHGDLKMSNILLKKLGNKQFELGLFDFDGSKFFQTKLPTRLRAKEYARVITSLNKLSIKCGCELGIEELEALLLKDVEPPDVSYLKKYVRKIGNHRQRY